MLRCKEKKEELDVLDNWSSKTDSYLFLTGKALTRYGKEK